MVQTGDARDGALPAFDAVILAGGQAKRLGGVDKPGLVVGRAPMAVSVTAAAVAAGARRVVLVGPARAALAADLTAAAAPASGGLTTVQEQPPGAGPVPALRTGLEAVSAPWVVLLAADLPFLRAAQLRDLLAAARAGSRRARGAVPGDGLPGGGVPGGAMLADAVPGGGVPGDAVPGDGLPGGAILADAVSSGAVSGGGVPGEGVPGDGVPGGAILADDAGRAQWLASCWQTAVLRSALASYGGSSLGGLFWPLNPVVVSGVVAPGAPPPWLDCDTPAELAAARAWPSGAASSLAAEKSDVERLEAER